MKNFWFLVVFTVTTTVVFAQTLHWQPCKGPYGARVRYFGNWKGGFLAYTNNGGVWQTTNNGEDWKEILTDIKEPINYVYGTDNFTIVTTDSLSLQSFDNGTTWQPLSAVFAPYNKVSTVTKIGNTYYASGAQAGVYNSTDNGKTWNGIGLGLASQIINGVVTYYKMYPIVIDTTLYIATGQGIYEYNPLFEMWKLKWRLDANDATVIATGAYYDHGTFLVSTKKGIYVFEDVLNKTWNKKVLNNIDIIGLIRNTDKVVATTISSDKFYLSYSYGLQWDTVTTTFPISKEFAFGYNDRRLVYNGDASKHIYASTTSGNSWQQLPDKIRNLQDFTMLATPTGILYEENYVNYYSNDNGETWDVFKLDSVNYLKFNTIFLRFFFKESNICILRGYPKTFTIYSLENRHLIKNMEDCIDEGYDSISTMFKFVYGGILNEKYCYSNSGLFRFSNAGFYKYSFGNWDRTVQLDWKISATDSTYIKPIAVEAIDNDLFIMKEVNNIKLVISNGFVKMATIRFKKTEVMKSIDNGLTWMKLNFPDTLQIRKVFVFSNSLYAYTFFNVNTKTQFILLRSVDRGETWQEIPVPLAFVSKFVSNKDQLYSINKNDIYVSVNRGDNWNKVVVDVLKPNQSIAEYSLGVTDNILYVGIKGSGIYYTNTQLLSVGEEVIKGNGISLFPNPAQQLVTIQGEGIKQVSIYSMVGELMQENQLLSSMDSSITIPVDHLTNGTYYAIINTGSMIKKLPFVVYR